MTIDILNPQGPQDPLADILSQVQQGAGGGLGLGGGLPQFPPMAPPLPPVQQEIVIPGQVRPTPAKLKRAKKVLNERLKASKKIVNRKKDKWQTWERMYKNEQISSKIEGESNLVLPKADYIAETISAKVINAIFSVQDWITLKHYGMDADKLRLQQKWFMWVLDRKVNFYLTALEMFKASPIKGTSICKVSMRNFWPFIDFIDLENFYPDTMARKPGDIQSMRYCMHQFKRALNQLENFKNSRGEQIYVNLDKLRRDAEQKAMSSNTTTTGSAMPGQVVELSDMITPIYDIIEYHGEFEYEKGKYEEYILAATLKDETSEEIDEMIRCEPSTFKIKDKLTEEDIYLKPFVSSIYSVNPGEFYGKSAISSVESLIIQQTELHNIYMDNHKRLVNGIVKILNRSDLTRDHIPQVSGATWYMDNFDDVEVETPPETNLLAYRTIHELLDKEIQKGSSVTNENLGVGSSKRETLGEVRSLLNEASERFRVFIQMSDRLTLRPIGQMVYALLAQTSDFFGPQNFTVDGEQINIQPDQIMEDMDVTFAATTVESEESKYSKQQTFPQVMQVMMQLAGDRLNADEVIKEFAALFNYNEPERFVNPSPTISIDLLPPELQQIATQIKAEAEQQGKQKGQQQLPQPASAPPPIAS